MRKKLEKLFAEFDEVGRDIQSTTKEALLLIADAIGGPPDTVKPSEDAPAKAAAKKTGSAKS